MISIHRGARLRAAALACATAPVYAPSALAQTPSTNASTPAMTLGDVVVSAPAGPLNTRGILSSVDVVPTARIERQVISNNWQLFDQLPGAALTRFGQGTTSGKFSMRGFNGEGEINAVKLLIDGVPSNSNDGNMPYIDLAPLLDIESIEVVRGTNDPRYGLHNIAGNANIATKFGGNYRSGRLTHGSFGTRDAHAAAGFDGNGLTQNYGLSLQHTDGFRAHSRADNAAFSGKWFYAPTSSSTRIGLIARHHRAKAEEAGYLTDAQVRDDPYQSPAHNASDEDRRRAGQFALQLESHWTPSLFFFSQIYLNDLDDRRFVRFSANVSQQERYVAERQIGGSATLTWRAGATALGDVAISGGIDSERQDNRSERYNTTNQQRSAQTRNQQFDFNTFGAFVQGVIKPSAALTLTPALRIDRISGAYNNLLNGQTYAINDYGTIKQPKFSAVYAFSDALALYGNWGRTFQVGVGTASYKVNQAADLSPSINDGWELGLRLRPLAWLDGRIALWRQTASNEARRKLNDPANDAENIGKTRRQGIDFQLNAKASDRIAAWAALALQRSKILAADAASAASQDREIDHVPHLLYNFGVDLRASDALNISAWANGQSNYYLERTNATGRYGSAFLLNAALRYRVSPAVELGLQLRNITDRYSEYVWFDGTQSLHAPAAPRSAYVSLGVTL